MSIESVFVDHDEHACGYGGCHADGSTVASRPVAIEQTGICWGPKNVEWYEPSENVGHLSFHVVTRVLVRSCTPENTTRIFQKCNSGLQSEEARQSMSRSGVGQCYHIWIDVRHAGEYGVYSWIDKYLSNSI